MQPTRADVHVDTVLTSMAVAYFQSVSNFIAGLVFPVVPVDKQSNKYRTWSKGDLLRDEMKLRAPATESLASGYSMSTDSYFADVWALAKYIADQDRRNADADVNLERGAVNFLMHRGLLRREVQWAADFFTTGKWATDKAVANKWSDYALSDPISDIEEGKVAMLNATGFEPNTITVGANVWRYLKNHPDIIDRLGLGGSSRDTRVVTREAIAAIFEVDRVLVAKAIRATSAEGDTVATAQIMGDHALLSYAPETPSVEMPSAGYIFGWTGLNGAGNVPELPGLTISRYREDLKKADKIEAEMAWDNKLTGSDLGYFFPSVV
jgi:hypothetical protein